MNARAVSLGLGCRNLWAVLALVTATTAYAADVLEQQFPLLQIGTQCFTNATVTTHSSEYVFIVHSAGMANIKVAKLTEEERERLGYVVTGTRPKLTGTNSVTEWARKQVTTLQPTELKKLKKSWTAYLPKTAPSLRTLPLDVLLVGCSVLLLLHVFFSFCCKRICEKAGTGTGPAIWFPVFQLIPLVRAAGMAPAWFVAFLVPGLNLIAQVVWSFKIVEARRKSIVVAVGLLLPVTNVLSFLYLAFSREAPTPATRPAKIQVSGAV